MKIEKKITKLLTYWTITNVIEAVTLIIILLVIPQDPKNAWLFGYSQSRVSIVSSALFYILALLYFNRLLSSPPTKLSKSLQRIQSYPSTNYLIEIIYGLSLLLLSFCIYYFFSVIPFDHPLEPLHIRLVPIIVFICLVITQFSLLLILFRLTIEGEKVTLGSILHSGSFPNLREKIFTYLDIKTHYFPFTEGEIRLSSIIYFLSLTALGLFIGSAAIEMRRWQ